MARLYDSVLAGALVMLPPMRSKVFRSLMLVGVWGMEPPNRTCLEGCTEKYVPPPLCFWHDVKYINSVLGKAPFRNLFGAEQVWG